MGKIEDKLKHHRMFFGLTLLQFMSLVAIISLALTGLCYWLL